MVTVVHVWERSQALGAIEFMCFCDCYSALHGSQTMTAGDEL